MRLLVCGSRTWSDRALLELVLDRFLADVWAYWGSEERPVIVEGEAGGADRMARAWAEKRGLPVDPHPADWRTGRGAGHARNAEMLTEDVEAVIAFSVSHPATPGTAGMCRLAYDAGVPVTFVTPDGRERYFFNQRWSTTAHVRGQELGDLQRPEPPARLFG